MTCTDCGRWASALDNGRCRECDIKHDHVAGAVLLIVSLIGVAAVALAWMLHHRVSS